MNKVWELLPEALQGQIEGLPEGERERIEEVRLRQGRPMSVSLPTGERFLAGDTVDGDALRRVLERASFFSVHTVLEQLRNGLWQSKEVTVWACAAQGWWRMVGS